MKKSSSKTNPLKKHIIVLYALVSGLIVGVFATCYMISELRQHNRYDQSAIVGAQIVSAVENLYRPTTIDPKERQQYFYEASLRTPTDHLNGNFRYSYIPSSEPTAFDQQITVTTDVTLRAGATGCNDFYKNNGLPIDNHQKTLELLESY
jgi:hypothetical protein